MAYLTENQLSNTVDIPLMLPSTDLRMGDWLVAAIIKVTAPMRLSYRVASLYLESCTVDTANISSSNKIYGNLGWVYLTLRKNYGSGSPGAAGGLDTLVASALGSTSRNIATTVLLTEPGDYSWIVANNTQPSSDGTSLISTSTSIDFRVLLSGSVRMELTSA